MTARLMRKLLTSLAALALMSGAATAQQMKVTIAVGGAGVPVLPADRAGRAARRVREGRRPAPRLVDFKGGSQALTAVLGGSADVVSGYFDHCVNLAAKNQHMQAFVVYDRYPGLTLVVGPKNTRDHQVGERPGRQAHRR